MRVRLRLDGRRPRRWHAWLARAVAGLPGHAVEIDDRPGGPDWPANADLLFRFEALVHRLSADGFASPSQRPLAASGIRAAGAPDLVLDLCGDVPLDGPVPVWRLTFDGAPGEAALLASALAGRVPRVVLADRDGPVRIARPGTEMHGVALATFEDALARTGTMIVAALAHPGPRPDAAACAKDGVAQDGMGEDAPAGPDLPLSALAARAARTLPRQIAKRLYGLAIRPAHWRVGWRRLDGPDLIDRPRHPAAGWRTLPDDGTRFYADPFPILHGGRHVLFVLLHACFN